MAKDQTGVSIFTNTINTAKILDCYFGIVFVFSCIFIFLPRESDQCAVRTRLVGTRAGACCETHAGSARPLDDLGNPEMETGRVDRHRSGQDSSIGRSSWSKNR